MFWEILRKKIQYIGFDLFYFIIRAIFHNRLFIFNKINIRHTLIEGFLTFQDTRIPIVIRVTDSNDNSPIFFNAPYFVNVSEVSSIQ